MAESPPPSVVTSPISNPVENYRYRVLFSHPLPSLDTVHARAYQAQNAAGEEGFLAYVCDRRYFPRLSACEVFARTRHSSLVQFEEWHLQRDSDGVERVVLIYQHPNKRLYLESLENTTTAMNLQDCVKRFLKPVLAPLNAIHAAGLTYRAFSPTNLFVQSSEMNSFVLGQCLSEPAGTLQPSLFETPTCAMAELQGRGSELAANDYYALGVMMFTLLRGHVPLRMLSEEAVILQKARLGSYRALLEHAQLEAESAEILRGLLDDNPGTRWGYDEVMSWLGGYRRSIDNHFTPPRAKVPYYLREQAITTRQEMSYLLHRDSRAAVGPSKQSDLGHWIRRSFADDADARAILQLQEASAISDIRETDLADNMTRTLILLNPLAPILWRDSSFTVTGIGNILAQYHAQPGKMAMLLHILRQGTHDFWMRHHIYSAPVYMSAVNAITSLVQRVPPGDSDFVMLRFFYTLNADAPCMSSLFSRDYVYGLNSFLERLEEKLKAQEEGTRLQLDSHILSYIAAYHDAIDTEAMMIALQKGDPVQSGLAQVRLLNIVQRRYNRVPTYHLCRALLPLLEPALERFRNLKKRKILQQNLQACVKDGWIEPMLALVDNPSLLAQDAKAYFEAQKTYTKNHHELMRIAHTHQDMPTQIEHTAHNAAMTTSSGLMVVGFIAMLLRLV